MFNLSLKMQTISLHSNSKWTSITIVIAMFFMFAIFAVLIPSQAFAKQPCNALWVNRGTKYAESSKYQGQLSFSLNVI